MPSDLPTAEDLAAAFRGGQTVRCGLPTHVRMAAGGTATLNLLAAQRGDPDPWLVTTVPAPGCVTIETLGRRGTYVSGMTVSETDLAAVDAAWLAAPSPEMRHDAGADEARRAAGRHAMRVKDAMIRARLLDAVDGWSAVLGPLVDEDPVNGRLHKSALAETERANPHRLLRVVCPSTGRAYVLRVPAEHQTAEAARRWVMGLPEGAALPEVET